MKEQITLYKKSQCRKLSRKRLNNLIQPKLLIEKENFKKEKKKSTKMLSCMLYKYTHVPHWQVLLHLYEQKNLHQDSWASRVY